jgi:predicted transcriptional regulator
MTTSIKLDSDERARLRALAAARDRTPHYLMREAIRQYLQREEARESLRTEALNALLESRELHRHPSAEDMHAWIEELSGLRAARVASR